MKLSHIPLRLSAGAFILNSGLSKRKLDREGAAGLQSMASSVFPALGRMEPEKFGKLLSYGETALGASLLLPILPSRLAGLGLVAFSGSLLAMYRKTPGMTLEGSIRPTPEGIGLAKDVWLLGMGLALLLDRKIPKAATAALAAAAAPVAAAAPAAAQP
ncbi:hypothetical protein GCM10023081_28670 [Arthrobacter ginkgonis]|uniref:DoxX family protein n=1 Tax=Arthrobacter ginkgonis TaxID=1630594 RepID=A0ABP7CJH7_9MICC